MIRGPSRGVSGWHPLALLPLALSAWVYHPITRVFFWADDFVHLTEIANERPLVFLLRPFGGHAFLTRNLVFLGSYHLFGVDPTARDGRVAGSKKEFGANAPFECPIFLLDNLGMTVPYLTVFLVPASRRLIAEAN
jgi:hypothetical protein